MGFSPNYIQMIAPNLDKEIYKRAKFHIDDLDTEKVSRKCQEPALFIHAKGDLKINPNNATRLIAAYGSQNKTLKLFEGDHKTERPKEIKD